MESPGRTGPGVNPGECPWGLSLTCLPATALPPPAPLTLGLGEASDCSCPSTAEFMGGQGAQAAHEAQSPALAMLQRSDCVPAGLAESMGPKLSCPGLVCGPRVERTRRQSSRGKQG